MKGQMMTDHNDCIYLVKPRLSVVYKLDFQISVLVNYWSAKNNINLYSF